MKREVAERVHDKLNELLSKGWIIKDGNGDPVTEVYWDAHKLLASHRQFVGVILFDENDLVDDVTEEEFLDYFSDWETYDPKPTRNVKEYLK